MAIASQIFRVEDADLFSTGIPERVTQNGTNFPSSGYAFDASTIESVYVKWNARDYLSGNLTCTVTWYSSAGNTSGNIVIGVQIAAISSGDPQNSTTKAFATANTATGTVNSTSFGLRDTAVTVTNLDSLALSDFVMLRLYRDASNVGDTLAGDAVFSELVIAYASTVGPGAGNVSNAGASTDNAIARFDLATGQVIQNSVVIVSDTGDLTGVATINTIDPATWVVGPASATSTAIVKYNGTTGKQVQNSGVTIDASNNVAGVGTLNTRTIANWVDGPATATSGRVAVFNGATGKLLQDGTKLEADLVTGPASATSGNLASYNGTTGKAIQDAGIVAANVITASTNLSVGFVPQGLGSKVIGDSSVAASNLVSATANITSGNVVTGTGTKVVQDSGVAISALPVISGTYVSGDVPTFNGTNFVPKFNVVTILSADFTVTSTSLAAVTGLAATLPRAGSYAFGFNGVTNTTTATTAHFYAVNHASFSAAAASGAWSVQAAGYFAYFQQTANNAVLATTTGGTAANGNFTVFFGGGITVSASGSLSFQAQKVTSGATMIIRRGSTFWIREV